MCMGKVWFICMLRLGEGGLRRHLTEDDALLSVFSVMLAFASTRCGVRG
jgi:hypothetical protein